MSDAERWRGLTALVRDAVTQGSRAVERIQLQTASRPFAVLERIPGIDAPSRTVHRLHTFGVSTAHAAVRLVARSAGAAIDTALALALAANARGPPSLTPPTLGSAPPPVPPPGRRGLPRASRKR